MSNERAPSEKLLTKGEVALLCRVEIRTVERWVAAGKIRCYRTPSGRPLFRKSDVLIPDNSWRERVVQSGRSSGKRSGNVSSPDAIHPALHR